MSKLLIVAVGVLATAGCTSLSLERHTLNQIQSSAEYRYQETLDCLATVADDGNALPSFALLSSGTAKVTDMASVTSTTAWTRSLGSFSTETLGATASRSPNLSWTVDPAADFNQLAALRAACQWVLHGPERANHDFPGILDSPVNNPSPGPHFGVADRLRQLPCGWLHVGRLTDVPLTTCHKAHHGDTWIWVNSEGMKGLADFTLVLLDIATLDPLGAIEAPPVLVTLTRQPGALYAFTNATWDKLPPADLIRLKEKFREGVAYSQCEFDSVMLSVYPNYQNNSSFQQDKTYLQIASAAQTKPPVFSDQLLYPEYRIIKPEHWRDVSQKIQAATNSQACIDIPWDEWSTPYHGQRTNVKQNTSKQPTPVGANMQIPPTRPLAPYYLLPPPTYQRTPAPPIGGNIP
jgi:hypothetical protein